MEQHTADDLAAESRRYGSWDPPADRTVGNFLTHLQAVFLVWLIPAWSRNLTSKVVRRPKMVVTGSGLAARLLGADATSLAKAGAPSGPLPETFVVVPLSALWQIA